MFPSPLPSPQKQKYTPKSPPVAFSEAAPMFDVLVVMLELKSLHSVMEVPSQFYLAWVPLPQSQQVLLCASCWYIPEDTSPFDGGFSDLLFPFQVDVSNL